MNGPPPRSRLGVADERLLAALAIAGDDEAFGELVRRRQEPIRQLLRRLCRDATLADDLAQQTFVQAWRSVRALRAPAAFGAWLRKLAVNVWLQHARTRAAQAREAAGATPPEQSVEPATGERLDLDHALAALPTPVRLCIVLAYAERMSHREVSEMTGIPLGTVKSHIARGAARLRIRLAAYG
ncbi:MAG TPA: sigma-70 family RNA polymerase sigma factor [Steroidobacteraceae bacterium]|nr:sigma-70 family RNA polymerase sigma factor [Steroidobacteraceae bacterium]